MTVDLYRIARRPVSVKIGKRRYRLASPKIGELYGGLEQLVLQHEADALQTVARNLDDAEQRTAFLVAGYKALPRGEQLQRLVWEETGTPEGLAWVIYCAAKSAGEDVTIEQVREDVLADEGEALAAMEIVFGPQEEEDSKGKKKRGKFRGRR